jgi:peptidylprolyl isomerase
MNKGLKKLASTALLFFLLFTISFAQKKTHYKKTSSGLEYAIIKKGNGEKLKKGYRVYVNYTTYLQPDSVYDTNSGRDKPFAFILGQEEVLQGWDEGLALLSVGDSAHFRIPPTLAYGSKKIGSIPANTTLLLHVKAIRTEQAFYDLAGKDTITFPSGLKKILISKGSGEMVKPFSNVTLQFTGYVLNQKGYKRTFQSSLTNSTLAVFQLGTGRMVKGLDEGIATMRVGEKATFILPPALGFGNKVSGVIPANSTLYFDIDVLAAVDPFYHCNRKDTIRTKNGVKILVCSSPELSKEVLTNAPRKGSITSSNVVTFDYTGYFIDTLGHPIIFDNTIERKTPTTIRPGSNRSLPGIEEGLTYLKKGEKAILYVPAELGFGKTGQGIIPPNKELIFDVMIVDTQAYPFFETSGDTLKQPSGLQYVQVRKGTGEAADTGYSVSLAYTGFTIDSTGIRKIFDASRESGRLLEFTLGRNKVIKGFEEGVKGMQLGEGRTLIIPYTLGYGENGIPEAGIPPRATIYFDVELVDIKKPGPPPPAKESKQ